MLRNRQLKKERPWTCGLVTSKRPPSSRLGSGSLQSGLGLVIRLEIGDDGLHHVDAVALGGVLPAFHPLSGTPVVGAEQHGGLVAQPVPESRPSKGAAMP